MAYRWWLVVSVLLAGLLAGCGGGGGGDGDGGIDPSVTMLGRWQPTFVTEDATVVPLRDAMDWDGNWTRVELEFLINATCTLYAYEGTQLVETITGTWSSESQVAPITFGGETTTITYWEAANLLTGTYTKDGHNYEIKWVKVITLTEHEAQLVGTWQAAAVKVNGVDTPIADFFEFDPGSDAMRLELQANGTAISREMAGSAVVNTETGTWATGGLEFTLAMLGDETRGYWNVLAGQFVAIFLDPGTGNTIEIRWNPA